MANKKVQVWLPLLFSITMVAGMYLGYKMRDNMPGKGFFYMQKKRPVQEVLDLVSNKYVDEVKTGELADTAIQAILSRLDPHSVFIGADEVDMVNEEMAGKFFGIGIEYEMYNDTLHVMAVVKDGPAAKAGVLPGDKFLKAGDSILSGAKLNARDIRRFLKGDRNTKVVVTILRNGAQQRFTITRDMIARSSVDASYMIDSNTGYIRLNKFSMSTYREFMQALDELHKNGLKKLILDLRGNGGGVLDQATAIADEFLEGDKLITYTEGAHNAKKDYRCQKVGVFEKEPLVILADEGTASASEVLLGALQDWDRATIIGRRSFGKGLVQEQYNLSNGSALRLTIARYYTPLGRSIQRSYANGQKSYYDEVMNRAHNLNTDVADTATHDAKSTFTTPKGKKLYGGGGISPDVFIKHDTTQYPAVSAIFKLNTKGTINLFSANYYRQHKAQLDAFKTPAAFKKAFVLTDADWQVFSAAAVRDSVATANMSIAQKNYLIGQLRSAIAYQLWRSQGYFEVANDNDAEMKKAIEMLQ
jgi:carboxyl-terminal processing protease